MLSNWTILLNNENVYFVKIGPNFVGSATNRENYYGKPLSLISSIIWIKSRVKGQLISKGNFVSSILPKNELENFNFCPSLLGHKFFVRFLEELKKPKSTFEIN